MLAFPSHHTKEGIQEARLATVEMIREALGDSEWEFISSSPDPDAPPVLATIGNARYGRPDLVLGFSLTDMELGAMRNHIGDMLAYLDWAKEPIDGDLVTEDFFEFLMRQRGYEGITALPTDRLHLRRIDVDRWFAGYGWQHAVFYNEDERKKAMVYQLVVSDAAGRLPWEQGYDEDYQLVLDKEPFGAHIGFERTPLQTARAKYLN